MQISLIEFSLENFKIFKERATFSAVARKNDQHTFESNGENLLKTSLIYGPNASGKTSIFDGVKMMREMIMLSANARNESTFPTYIPFFTLSTTKSRPINFELVFSITGDFTGVFKYSFGFLSNKIVTENLVELDSNGTEETLFDRVEQNIKLGKYFENEKVVSEKTRDDALFLSVSAQFNNKFALNIFKSMAFINVISGTNDGTYKNFTLEKISSDTEYRSKIINYLKEADFCISDGLTKEVSINRVDIKDDLEGFSASKKVEKGNALFLKHPIYNQDKEVIGQFELPIDFESVGTQKFLSALGPIIDTLTFGKVLFIDEFDNSLHPLLTKFIVDLFESKETNKNNAQLIVTTHDTSLLGYKEDFIKDQFWFTEKDSFGQAKLFSLAEFDMRNDTEYSKKYLEGRFGALPFINSVKK